MQFPSTHAISTIIEVTQIEGELCILRYRTTIVQALHKMLCSLLGRNESNHKSYMEDANFWGGIWMFIEVLLLIESSHIAISLIMNQVLSSKLANWIY